MLDPSRLALFAGAALLLLVVPGPSVLYIVTLSVSHGRRAGIASVAVASNLVGGLAALVTFARSAQALGVAR
jgi:threonine/homoserine/homoserine lactone efflux protein